jgi:hypothetical protein
MGALVLFWIAAIVVAGLIGSSKNKAGTGVALGLLLGWIGVIIAACLSADPPPAPSGRWQGGPYLTTPTPRPPTREEREAAGYY